MPANSEHPPRRLGDTTPDAGQALLVGPHVSVAGGLINAFANGRAVGASCIQIFTRNQRQWQAPPISDTEVDAFLAAWAESEIRMVMSHGSYLINLGAPDEEKLARSRALFAEEVERCLRLGLSLVTVHPGASLDGDRKAGLRRVADSVREVLPLPAEALLRLTLENTAGQGTTLGATLEELAEMLELIGPRQEVGVCLDTCHLFAAGYDIAHEEGWAAFWVRFRELIGMERLMAFHVNDSKKPLGSRLDRHENLGAGHMGWDVFRRLVAEPALGGIPLFLETPGGEAPWTEEIRRLRAFARDARG